MNLVQFTELKEEVERLERNKERAKGSLDQQFKELEERFGCKSLAEAVESLAILQSDLKTEERRYSKVFEKFEESTRERTDIE